MRDHHIKKDQKIKSFNVVGLLMLLREAIAFPLAREGFTAIQLSFRVTAMRTIRIAMLGLGVFVAGPPWGLVFAAPLG